MATQDENKKETPKFQEKWTENTQRWYAIGGNVLGVMRMGYMYDAQKARAATEASNANRQKFLLEAEAKRELLKAQNLVNNEIARRQTKEFRTKASINQLRDLSINEGYYTKAATLGQTIDYSQRMAAIDLQTKFFTGTTDAFSNSVALYQDIRKEQLKQLQAANKTNSGGVNHGHQPNRLGGPITKNPTPNPNTATTTAVKANANLSLNEVK